MSQDDFARVQLLFGPSRGYPLERVSEHLGGAFEDRAAFSLRARTST